MYVWARWHLYFAIRARATTHRPLFRRARARWACVSPVSCVVGAGEEETHSITGPARRDNTSRGSVARFFLCIWGMRARMTRDQTRALDLLTYDVHVGETLESVSSCTRFSGILKISNFGFNRSSSKLVGMFFGIVPMFVLKDFVQDCFVAQICAKMCVRAVIRAYLRDEAIRNKILGYEH